MQYYFILLYLALLCYTGVLVNAYVVWDSCAFWYGGLEVMNRRKCQRGQCTLRCTFLAFPSKISFMALAAFRIQNMYIESKKLKRLKQTFVFTLK